MTIATANDIIAGLRPPESFCKVGPTTVAGRLISLAYATGAPGAIATPSPGIAGAALTTLAGQIPFTNPGGGDNTHLARVVADSSQPGTLYVIDRLWHNSGIVVTSTGSQAVSSVALPSRDRDGVNDGEGVYVGMEVSTVLGAATPTITLGYTNSDGTAGRSSVSAAIPSAMAAGSFFQLGLQAGDTGVRSIDTIQHSASMISGAYHLVMYRILAVIPLPAVGIGQDRGPLELGLPRLYDNTVPMLLFNPNTANAPNVNGQLIYTQG